MSTTSDFRCATAARSRDDPMAGTAPPARRWVLIEHPGPWPIDAVAGSGIEPTVLAAVQTAAQSAQARILLIRRPGRLAPDATRRWFVLGLDQPTVVGEWTADQDLLDIVPVVATPRPTSRPDASDPPMILVCTHGIHDACCAIRGRPVASALARRWPDQVWECTHVGGDRFAPNVVLLPDGFYYGSLDPGSAVDIVARHLAGTVPAESLRGMARYRPPVQAAVIEAHAKFGPLGVHDIEVVGVRQEGPHDGHGSKTFVDLEVRTDRIRMTVLSIRRAEKKLTCRAIRSTPATEYRIEATRPMAPPPGRDPSAPALGS